MENIQRLYQEAIKFAAVKHKDQKFPGYDDIPYLVHVCDVAMEILAIPSHANGFDTGYAVQVALLHDTIEDTETSYEELAVRFGKEIADGVSALTKNENLPREMRMADSIERIKKLRNEVWAVKLADRITNLQPPPRNWNSTKKKEYLCESVFILDHLHHGNEYLAARLRRMIDDFGKFV